jgi:hypothetical protein
MTSQNPRDIQALESGLRTYLATLIECVDECERGNDSAELLQELGTLLNDPPGLNALGPKHPMRKDLSIIRAKYFVLNRDLDAAKSEFASSSDLYPIDFFRFNILRFRRR